MAKRMQVDREMTSNPLYWFTQSKAEGASFAATDYGTLATIKPLTAAADVWLRGHSTSEARWQGDALVVEKRFFPAIADVIIEVGFTFER